MGTAVEGDRCSSPTINPNYGDRVAQRSQNGGRMQYGEQGEGWTPNIVVDYGPDPTAIRGTDKSYAGLWTVIWTEERSGELTIRFSADPGYQSLFYGLKIGGYVFNPGPWPLVIGQLAVRDQSGATLWSAANIALNQTSPFVLSLSQPLVGGDGGWLEFYMDVRNLPVGSFARESVGVDLVRFGQAAVTAPAQAELDAGVANPEPGALWLAGTGLIIVLLLRNSPAQRAGRPGLCGLVRNRRHAGRATAPLLLLVVCLTHSMPARATLLVFDQCGGDPNAAIRDNCNGGPVNIDYGDRATDISANGGLFAYIDDGEGWTPNVVVDYGPDASRIYGWSTGYRSMANVLWADKAEGKLAITLQADPGYRVLLYHFELAIFSDSISSLTVGSIRVVDQSGALLLDQSNTVLTRSTPFHFFLPATSGSGGSLRIEFDVTNLPVGFEREYLAIDNIRFGQEFAGDVPEPATAALLIPMLAAVACRAIRVAK